MSVSGAGLAWSSTVGSDGALVVGGALTVATMVELGEGIDVFGVVVASMLVAEAGAAVTVKFGSRAESGPPQAAANRQALNPQANLIPKAVYRARPGPSLVLGTSNRSIIVNRLVMPGW